MKTNLISILGPLSRTTERFGARRAPVFLQTIVVCAGLALLLSSPAIAGDKVDKEAYIDCINGTFDSLESYKEKNEVFEGYKLTWYVRGKKDTTVKITFVKKMNACKGESPFPESSYSDTVSKDYGFAKIPTGKVKTGSENACYTYTITCAPLTGQGHTIDPIIDVPKP